MDKAWHLNRISELALVKPNQANVNALEEAVYQATEAGATRGEIDLARSLDAFHTQLKAYLANTKQKIVPES